MRFVKTLVGIALAISILLNITLIVKRHRKVFAVNGQVLLKTDMDNYLETHYGPPYKALMVQRFLIDQEAHQQGVAPTDAEIEEEFDLKKELDWQYALKLARSPWLADEARNEIKQEYEQEHLLAKDINVTDEEIKDEYNANKALYDMPNKAKCQVAAILNEARADEVHSLMAQNPPVNPVNIMGAFPREVIFLGDGNRFTFSQPYGTDVNKEIFTMDAKSVKVLPPGELASLGARKVIVRLEELVPGHRAELNDPKVLKRIRLHVALHRSKPLPELLSTLWAKANIVFEDPIDRINTEQLFFPERARAQGK